MDDDTPYMGPERRLRVRIPEDLEAKIALAVDEEVERRLEKLENKLMQHMDAKFAQLHRVISDAFPGGDPHGHRAYHELQIKQADGWDRLKADILSKFLTSGLWVASGYLFYLIWSSIKENLRS